MAIRLRVGLRKAGGDAIEFLSSLLHGSTIPKTAQDPEIVGSPVRRGEVDDDGEEDVWIGKPPPIREPEILGEDPDDRP